MGVGIEWVGYGRDAAEALRARIAIAKGGEPLAPVTVVVPSNQVGVAARRLLASGALGPVCGRGTGLVGVTFLTPYRLAELLGAARLAASGRRPVSTPVLAAAIRASLAEDPGLFRPVAAHPATETALAAAYRELRDLSPEALVAVSTGGERAADVVRLHRAARARLEGAWYDEEDLMASAAEALRAGEGVAGALGTVVAYLPQRLSRHAATLLTAAADTTDLAVLAGTTGQPDADHEVRSSLDRLGGGPPPPVFGPQDLVGADRTRFVTTSDADDEVRAAVRAVVDAARSGVPLDRVAVLHASAEPYARIIHEQLAAAGIAANGSAVMPVSARLVGRALLDLLALPEGGFSRQDVCDWLAAAPVLHRGRWAPVTAWERLSRDAGVVAGRSEWDQRLASLADELEGRAVEAEADPDGAAWKAERWRGAAARARGLRDFALAVIDDLTDAATRDRPWPDHAAWARERLARLIGGAARRDGWPVAERKAAERVELGLERLAALGSVEGPVGLDVFIRTLQLELDADLGRVGRFGEGVLVGPVAMGVGLDLDLVVIVGLAEGSFPTAVRDDSLLPDHEREVVGGQLALRRERVGREHRELLASLAGARRHVLCLPRGDLRRSNERVPSRWAVELASAMAGDRWSSRELLRTAVGWVEHVPSFDAGLRRVGFPATEQEYRLRALLADPVAQSEPDAIARSPDAVLARGAAAVTARRGTRFTPFDGNLAGLDIPSPASIATSATRLERWAGCPFAYLMADVLDVAEVEHPEDLLRISPLTRGGLVHRALEQFVGEVLVRDPGRQPTPDEPWSETDHERMAAIGAVLCDEYQARGLTGRPIFWRRDRRDILEELRLFLLHDSDDRAARRSRPVAAELPFGLPGSALEAVALRLPDGRTVRLRGKADRVDRAEDGTVYVIDYKTGSATSFASLSEQDPDLQGRKLQLPVYAEAARLHQGRPDAPVVAEYWFVSIAAGFERRGYPVNAEVLERVSQTLGTIVAGIEAGVFPAHPTATSSSPRVACPYCDPDGLGVSDLRRQWERKRLDPAVAAYAELAEPTGEPAGEDEQAAEDDQAAVSD